MPPRLIPPIPAYVQGQAPAVGLRCLYFFLVQHFENEPRAAVPNPKTREMLTDILVESLTTIARDLKVIGVSANDLEAAVEASRLLRSVLFTKAAKDGAQVVHNSIKNTGAKRKRGVTVGGESTRELPMGLVADMASAMDTACEGVVRNEWMTLQEQTRKTAAKGSAKGSKVKPLSDKEIAAGIAAIPPPPTCPTAQLAVIFRGPHGLDGDCAAQALTNGLISYLRATITRDMLKRIACSKCNLEDGAAELATTFELASFVAACALPTKVMEAAMTEQVLQDYDEGEDDMPLTEVCAPTKRRPRPDTSAAPAANNNGSVDGAAPHAASLLVGGQERQEEEETFEGVPRSELLSGLHKLCGLSRITSSAVENAAARDTLDTQRREHLEKLTTEALYVILKTPATKNPAHQALLQSSRLPLSMRSTPAEITQWYWKPEINKEIRRLLSELPKGTKKPAIPVTSSKPAHLTTLLKLIES